MTTLTTCNLFVSLDVDNGVDGSVGTKANNSNEEYKHSKQATKCSGNKRTLSQSVDSSELPSDEPSFEKRKTGTIDILKKIFPKAKCAYLEHTLGSCNDDVLKTIEILIKDSHNEEESSSDSEHNKLGEAVSEQSKVPIKIPFDTDFSEIRKQCGFNKKKPKNSFVRHKANYENALREQASKGGIGANKPTMMDLQSTSNGSDVPLDSISQPLSFKPNQPTQQLLSIFANPSLAGTQPTDSTNHSTFISNVDSASPASSPPNLLTTCPTPLSSIATNLSNISQQQRSLMNARNVMLNPSLIMPNNPNSFLGNPQLRNEKVNLEMDNKLVNQSAFLPTATAASSMPHLSRNLFDSLVASTGYRSLFPAFFPGAAPNLASLGLLSAGLPGLGMVGSNEHTGNLMPNNALQLNSFEQNFDEFNQKLANQRTHQLQSALSNICGGGGDNNGWYAMGADLLRNNTNSHSTKCDDKNDSI